jgi:F-type H+-transporting ATPase subunit b
MLEINGTLIVMAISFIIFMVVMQKIFYAPMYEVKEERNGYINENISSARKAQEEASNIAKNYDNNITQARIKANNLVMKSMADANQEKAELIKRVENEVNIQINTEKENISKDKNNAKEELKSQIIPLAHSISMKVLGEEIPLTGINQELINKVLNR